MLELDGIKNGIAIYVTYSDTGKKRFLQTAKNDNVQIKLLNNLRTAKSVAKNISGIIPEETKFYIVLEDKKYPLKIVKYDNNSFKLFDTETSSIISIREKLTYKATKFYYIVFDHGDTKRYDKHEGKEKRNKYFQDIAQAIESLLLENNKFGIEYVDKFKSEYVIYVKNCSATIHICTNSNIININQSRKEYNQKSYPFIKSMDKYTTFYAYISKDISEPSKIESDIKAFELLENIVYYLSDMNTRSNVLLSDIGYTGYIIYNE